MKLKITLIKAQLLVALLGLSLFTFAQIPDNDKKLLQGKWVLESVTAQEANDTAPAYVDSLSINIYDVIEIKQDMMTLTGKKSNNKRKYTVDNNILHFDSLPASTDVAWYISENKLHVQQIVKDPLNESIIVLVSLIYKRE